MKQNQELPPGWGRDSFQDNPWKNTPQKQPVQQPEITQQHENNMQNHPWNPAPHNEPVPQLEKPVNHETPVPEKPITETIIPAVQNWAEKAKSGISSIKQEIPKPEIKPEPKPKSAPQPKAKPAEPTPFRENTQAPPAAKPAVFNSSDFDSQLPPIFNNSYDNPPDDDKASVSPLIFLIPIITAILAFLVGFLLMRAKGKTQNTAEVNTQQMTVAVTEQATPETGAQTEAVLTETKPVTETEAITESPPAAVTEPITAATQKPAEKKTAPATEKQETAEIEYHEEPVQREQTPQNPASEPASPAQSSNAEFRSVVEQYGAEMNTGYFTDVNGDGRNELILKDPYDMCFHMYAIGPDGSDGLMHDTYFGAFKSMSETKLFVVPASGSQYYFYWRCEYALYSIQGYYDPITNSEIDIGVNYNFEDHAEWVLFFNNKEYASGREEGGSTYGATPECAQKLLEMFKEYGFQINDNSEYIKLECLNKNALLSRIG